MNGSRRQVLVLLSGTVLTGTAGCTQFGFLDSEESPNDTAFTVRISGPDGEQIFFETDDIASVGSVEEHVQSGYTVPVQLTEEGTENATEAFRHVGAAKNPADATIAYTIDGEESQFGVTPPLAEAIDSEEWDGEFNLVFSDSETAHSVRDDLRREQE